MKVKEMKTLMLRRGSELSIQAEKLVSDSDTRHYNSVVYHQIAMIFVLSVYCLDINVI